MGVIHTDIYHSFLLPGIFNLGNLRPIIVLTIYLLEKSVATLLSANFHYPAFGVFQTFFVSVGWLALDRRHQPCLYTYGKQGVSQLSGCGLCYIPVVASIPVKVPPDERFLAIFIPKQCRSRN